MAIPSSTAIVLNSRGTAPAAFTESETTWPTSRRCTWPGTNSVKLLATATIGLPMSSPATPLARMRARAPTMFLPWVTVRDRSGGMTCSPQGCGAFSVPAACPPCGARPPAGQAMIVVDFASPAAQNPPRSWPGWEAALARRPPGGRRVRSAAGQGCLGRLVDALDFLAGQPLLAPGPGLGAQVLAEPPPAEHVHAADPGHGPRDRRAVDHHGRADPLLAAEGLADEPAGHGRFHLGVLQAAGLAVRAVVEVAALGGPERQPAVPPLGVHREHPGRPDDQMIDDAVAARDGPAVQGQVAGPAGHQQPPPGAPLRGRDPDRGRDDRGGPRPVDGVQDRHDGRGGQAGPPVEEDAHHDAGRGRQDRPADPDRHPGIRGETGQRMLMTRMTVTRGDDPAIGAVPGLRRVRVVRPAPDNRPTPDGRPAPDGRELAGVRLIPRIRVRAPGPQILS